MRVFLWSLTGFVAGLAAGYGGVLFGWIGCAELLRVADPDGGKLMGVAFVAAPVGGLVAGLIAAFWLALRAAHRQETAPDRPDGGPVPQRAGHPAWLAEPGPSRRPVSRARR